MSVAVRQTETNKGTDWSSRILGEGGGGGELPCVKKQRTCCIMIISCQGDFKEQVQKLVKFLFHTTENRWRQILCTFCTQSVIRGLTRLFELPTPFWSKRQTLAVFVPQSCVCVCVCVCVFLYYCQDRKSEFCSILIHILCVNVCGLRHCRRHGKNRVHTPFMV